MTAPEQEKQTMQITGADSYWLDTDLLDSCQQSLEYAAGGHRMTRAETADVLRAFRAMRAVLPSAQQNTLGIETHRCEAEIPE